MKREEAYFMPITNTGFSRGLCLLILLGGMPLFGQQLTADRGILPDYPVHYSIEEMLQAKDKEMDLAMELARE